jgi:hypothetical protein
MIVSLGIEGEIKVVQGENNELKLIERACILGVTEGWIRLE